MDFQKIAQDIIDANVVVENQMSKQHEYIFHNDVMAKHYADMEFQTSMILKGILADEKNKDLPSAKIKLMVKVETAEYTRLMQLAKSVKKTLENLIYRGYK
jgi:hypothetical protein